MPLSTLCQRCGLCCDGTLFSQVPLQPSEAAVLRQHALPLVQRADGSPALPQRCAALEGRRCTVYAERPATCRGYRCHLLVALAEGEVSLDEALHVIDGAHSQLRALEAELPPGDSGSVMQRARRASSGGTLTPAAQEAWERSEEYLDRHLRGRMRRG